MSIEFELCTAQELSLLKKGWECVKSFLPQIHPILRDILYLTSVLNSCINPFIYGVYYLTGFGNIGFNEGLQKTGR